MSGLSTAIVLAGGLGTRLRTVVSDVPKPMAPVRGKPFLEYLLAQWAAKGIERFILSVGYQHDIITRHFGDRFQGAAIEYAVEQGPMGTGGGLLLCAPAAGETFLLLNGDTFFDVSLEDLTAAHRDRNSDWTFSLFRSSDAQRYMAVQIGPDGLIHGLGRKPDTPSFLVNGGVYLVNRRLLDGRSTPTAPLSLESELLPALLAQGARMAGLEQDRTFIDIGVPDDYARADSVLPH